MNLIFKISTFFSFNFIPAKMIFVVKENSAFISVEKKKME